MRVLNVSHKGINYEFRLLEAAGVIQITKGGVFSYLMSRKGYRPFSCNCPGGRWHGYCWHLNMISDVFNSPRINEPWAIWAEEAEVWKEMR